MTSIVQQSSDSASLLIWFVHCVLLSMPHLLLAFNRRSYWKRALNVEDSNFPTLLFNETTSLQQLGTSISPPLIPRVCELFEAQGTTWSLLDDRAGSGV
ncbi:hypothetical protein B0H16DRAFT_1616326, partial [Mycena metata]